MFLVLIIAALIFGAVILIQSAGKDWRGWGVVICLAVALLLDKL